MLDMCIIDPAILLYIIFLITNLVINNGEKTFTLYIVSNLSKFILVIISSYADAALFTNPCNFIPFPNEFFSSTSNVSIFIKSILMNLKLSNFSNSELEFLPSPYTL